MTNFTFNTKEELILSCKDNEELGLSIDELEFLWDNAGKFGMLQDTTIFEMQTIYKNLVRCIYNVENGH